MMDKIKQLRWLWITVFILWLDFVSKDLANHYLKTMTVKIFPFLNLTLVHNAGAAFGLLAEASGWQTEMFVIIAGVISVLMLVWLMMLQPNSRVMSIAISLILGGALGNLYDRIVAGEVTDFIDAHYHELHWPVFNIADTAVTLGVFLLMIGLIRKSV
jgi:signal peptidase II